MRCRSCYPSTGLLGFRMGVGERGSSSEHRVGIWFGLVQVGIGIDIGRRTIALFSSLHITQPHLLHQPHPPPPPHSHFISHIFSSSPAPPSSGRLAKKQLEFREKRRTHPPCFRTSYTQLFSPHAYQTDSFGPSLCRIEPRTKSLE